MPQEAAKLVRPPDEPEKVTWVGALVPAVELDEAEAGDMIVIVVKLIDDRQAADVLCLALCSEQLSRILYRTYSIVLAFALLASTLTKFHSSMVTQWRLNYACKPHVEPHAST